MQGDYYKATLLERKSNMLRHEEITEEIEMIFLSTESLSVN